LIPGVGTTIRLLDPPEDELLAVAFRLGFPVHILGEDDQSGRLIAVVVGRSAGSRVAFCRIPHALFDAVRWQTATAPDDRSVSRLGTCAADGN
jgi:hypothetical protein